MATPMVLVFNALLTRLVPASSLPSQRSFQSRAPHKREVIVLANGCNTKVAPALCALSVLQESFVTTQHLSPRFLHVILWGVACPQPIFNVRTASPLREDHIFASRHAGIISLLLEIVLQQRAELSTPQTCTTASEETDHDQEVGA